MHTQFYTEPVFNLSKENRTTWVSYRTFKYSNKAEELLKNVCITLLSESVDRLLSPR